jgi:hypothetical protein
MTIRPDRKSLTSNGDCCVFCSYGTVQSPPTQDGTQGAQDASSSQNG